MRKILIVLVLLVIAAVFFVASRVPTINDAKASALIYDEVLEGAQKNGISLDRSTLRFTPKRNGTGLRATSQLMEKDKDSLRRLVEVVSRHHADRKVWLEFQ